MVTDTSPPRLKFRRIDDGNLVSDGRWVYAWDGENRLIAMEPSCMGISETDGAQRHPKGDKSVGRSSHQPTATAIAVGVPKRRLVFAYDAQSRRIRKQVYGWDAGTSTWTLNSERRFIHDQWNMVAEVDAAGTPLRTHVWGLDVSQTMQGAGGVGGLLWSTNHADSQPSTTNYPLYDGNGNVTVLVDAGTAAVSARYDYNAFGQTVLIEGGQIAENNPFRFSTKYEDAETGLYYYGFRYYLPELGRWLNRDPIEEQGGISLYGMVGNDPVNRWDYLGLSFPTIPKPPGEFSCAIFGFFLRNQELDRANKVGMKWFPWHVEAGLQTPDGRIHWPTKGIAPTGQITDAMMRVFRCCCMTAEEEKSLKERIKKYLDYMKNTPDPTQDKGPFQPPEGSPFHQSCATCAGQAVGGAGGAPTFPPKNTDPLKDMPGFNNPGNPMQTPAQPEHLLRSEKKCELVYERATPEYFTW